MAQPSRDKFEKGLATRLTTGEIWRDVKFVGGEEVGYLPVKPNEARTFDQIIGSACLSPAT